MEWPANPKTEYKIATEGGWYDEPKIWTWDAWDEDQLNQYGNECAKAALTVALNSVSDYPEAFARIQKLLEGL